MAEEQVPAIVRMREWITGFRLTQTIYVAARLGIADTLRDGPRSATEIAKQIDADPDMVFRLLRALAGCGIFAEDSEGVFALNPHSNLLCDDHPHSLRHYAILHGEEVYTAFGDLTDCVKSGDVAFERMFGSPFFDYLQARPEKAESFNLAMTSLSAQQNEQVIDLWDFSNYASLCDVGGGHGSLVRQILEKEQDMRGVVYDLPAACAQGRKVMPEELSARMSFSEGSFFEDVPEGFDLYLLKYILHDWDDERSLKILRHCRGAMKDHAQLMVIEKVVGPGREGRFAKLDDLEMKVLLGGRERSLTEFEELLGEAGFRVAQHVRTDYLFGFLVCDPV